jgi:mono/diheme cytochrome c family protein
MSATSRAASWLCAAAAMACAHADDSTFTSHAGVGTASGAQIYSHICQGCHMPDGQGAVGAGRYPRLAGDPALSSWQYVALIVLGGRNGMPAFGLSAPEVLEMRAVRLSDAQVADVVNYVRQRFGKQQGGVTASQVAALPHPGRDRGS